MYVLRRHNFLTQADCIIFFFFSFFVSLLSLQHVKIVMPKNASQSKDANKWPTDANFQTPAPTGRKVEMASANAVRRKWPVKTMGLTLYQVTKNSDLSKFKDFQVTEEEIEYVFERLENILEKNITGYQHFIHFPHCFQKAFFWCC